MNAIRQPRSGDARAVLAFAADLADCRDAPQFAAQVEVLPQLIGADGVIVTGCWNWAEDLTFEVADPRLYGGGDLLGAVERYWEDHPVLTRDLTRANRTTSRTSDFVRQREWRRSDLFNDFYRPLGMTWELSAQLAWGPVGSSCCVTLHNAGRDFSERDGDLLELVAPHLRAARARVAASAAAARRLELLERGVEADGRGALLLDRRGRLVAVGERARDLLERWFGPDTTALPSELAEWLVAARKEPTPLPYELDRDGSRLRARLLPGGEETLVLLSERGATPSAPRLARLLPITPREAEVLARLTVGRTNDGIAHDLGISRHTVVRHVERLYAKLGVHTRVAATRVALDALLGDS